MRAVLNRLYSGALGLAAICLVMIAALVVAQVSGRIIDGARSALGLDPWGLLVPSLAEFAGFLLVGASFLALAGTLRGGAHIRVSILLQSVPSGIARFLDLWSLLAAFSLTAFFTWQAALLALDSFQFNEVSFGIIPVPLVIPQSVMTAGLLVFTVSLLDDLITVLRGGQASFAPHTGAGAAGGSH
ncbi:C4-dicarboxylate ABC transporter permease [Roseibium aquae]|uniref:TRAP transporter small permease protein n=1 Tax=Roseibium aquae TaxID=1323746 RepID=A0A916TA23_9HYPH|nr:TRAP transporter small permease [Roseibium aquae]GGB35993.1 C4-dicarboxylate ABC transporter permease [Roseibium aquae]